MNYENTGSHVVMVCCFFVTVLLALFHMLRLRSATLLFCFDCGWFEYNS